MLSYYLTACYLSLVSVKAEIKSLVAPSKLHPDLAAGKIIAVICLKYSYLRQMIADSNFGVNVENSDSMTQSEFISMLNSDRKLAELIDKAYRKYLQLNFTQPIIAKQYFCVL